MRTLVLIIAIAISGGSLAACASPDPWDPAIRAMEPVNSCGTYGSDDVNQCRGHPRSNN